MTKEQQAESAIRAGLGALRKQAAALRQNLNPPPTPSEAVALGVIGWALNNLDEYGPMYVQGTSAATRAMFDSTSQPRPMEPINNALTAIEFCAMAAKPPLDLKLARDAKGMCLDAADSMAALLKELVDA